MKTTRPPHTKGYSGCVGKLRTAMFPSCADRMTEYHCCNPVNLYLRKVV